jgi:nitroimidazol reductase NimA-like FMN-containing flavoprotein (pyridoxamine 5'-phosphate oxidase superfamily)
MHEGAMLGDLTEQEMEDLLRSETIGRLGCHAAAMTYVVPVAYAFEGGYVYGHSPEGRKIRMMRRNPEVCFEVDHITSIRDWKSVISWGRYEELKGDAARAGIDLVMTRLSQPALGTTGHPSYPLRQVESRPPDPDGPVVVAYRIRLMRMRGRFERP